MSLCLSPDVIRHAKEIKENSGHKSLWINHDQAETCKRKYALTKACYMKMMDKGHSCSLRGSSILYGKRQYGYEMLSLLPTGCRPEDVKTRLTTDGKGRAFLSEHVYCSNFALAPLRYEDAPYVSAEHAFQTTKAKSNGYDQLAREMLSMASPYYVKKLGNSLEVKDEWKEQEKEILESIMRCKFEQNPRLRRKLVIDTCTNFYEMTNNKFWGTVARITADMKTVEVVNLTGKNTTGEILKH